MINIKKSQPAPLCLSDEKKKATGDYKCGDVLKRLEQDFHNKCYICEEREPSTINVEHFKPHKNDKNLKFDWNNLFWACGHCNNVKLAKYDNLIDCTDETEVITDLLKFEIKPFPREKAKISALISNPKVDSTAQLLNEVYNGTTELKNIESLNIRNKLIREIIDFQSILTEYYFEVGLSEQERGQLRVKMKRKLSSEAAFTAFKIWIIKENKELFNEFKDLIGR